jgi:hypothetical protein
VVTTGGSGCSATPYFTTKNTKITKERETLRAGRRGAVQGQELGELGGEIFFGTGRSNAVARASTRDLRSLFSLTSILEFSNIRHPE